MERITVTDATVKLLAAGYHVEVERNIYYHICFLAVRKTPLSYPTRLAAYPLAPGNEATVSAFSVRKLLKRK